MCKVYIKFLLCRIKMRGKYVLCTFGSSGLPSVVLGVGAGSSF